MAEENKNEVMEQETEETKELRPVTGTDILFYTTGVIILYKGGEYLVKKGAKWIKTKFEERRSKKVNSEIESDIVDADVKEVKSEE